MCNVRLVVDLLQIVSYAKIYIRYLITINANSVITPFLDKDMFLVETLKHVEVSIFSIINLLKLVLMLILNYVLVL